MLFIILSRNYVKYSQFYVDIAFVLEFQEYRISGIYFVFNKLRVELFFVVFFPIFHKHLSLFSLDNFFCWIFFSRRSYINYSLVTTFPHSFCDHIQVISHELTLIPHFIFLRKLICPTLWLSYSRIAKLLVIL